MTRAVEVRTGARLHFGLFDRGSEQERIGGIGMMIDRPGLVLNGAPCSRDEDHIDAPAAEIERIQNILDRVRHADSDRFHRLESAWKRMNVDLSIIQCIPAHRGYGSGTQLSFAVAAAYEALVGSPPASNADVLGRGKRSLVGSLGFFRGGFVVDDPAATSATRVPVPEGWRFVIVEPAQGAGPFGGSETALFENLSASGMPDKDDLRPLVEEAILPALADVQFPQFAAAVAEFNRRVGERFKSVQGGVYASPLIAEAAERLADSPWPDIAQSSWGPASAVFCESEDSAAEAVHFLRQSIPTESASIFVARPLNQGAGITVRSDADRTSGRPPG